MQILLVCLLNLLPAHPFICLWISSTVWNFYCSYIYIFGHVFHLCFNSSSFRHWTQNFKVNGRSLMLSQCNIMGPVSSAFRIGMVHWRLLTVAKNKIGLPYNRWFNWLHTRRFLVFSRIYFGLLVGVWCAEENCVNIWCSFFFLISRLRLF